MATAKMVLHHLRSDELMYEMRRRGVDATGMTVVDMRASLRSFVRLEKENQAVTYAGISMNTASELTAIAKTFAELEALLLEAEADSSGAKGERGCSRALHLLGRVNRLPTTGDDTTVVTSRSTWLAKVAAILTRFQKSKPKPRDVNLSSTLSEVEHLPSAELEDSEAEEDSGPEEPSAMARVGTAAATDRRIPVYK